MTWDRRILAFKYSFKKSIHVICSERRHELTHFINYTSKRPNVWFQIVWLIFPDLRWCVVGSSSLCVKQAFFGNFGYIKVSELRSTIFVQKYVCWLHISVQYFELMERFQTFNYLNQYLPDVFLFHVHFVSLAIANSLKYVSIIGILHDDTRVTITTYHSELLASSKNAYL